MPAHKKAEPRLSLYASLTSSRSSPMTVSTTPPSSITSARFHTRCRSLFPAWGSWI